MKRQTITACTVLTLTVSATVPADEVDAAYKVCRAFEGTGLTTGCEVNGWKQNIDVRIDMSSSEARKLCTQLADMQSGQFPDGRWSLRILSPYSGDQPIAVCNLR